MPCGWEGNRRTSVFYPPTDSRPNKGRRAPRLHSSCLGMAQFICASRFCIGFVKICHFTQVVDGQAWFGPLFATFINTVEIIEIAVYTENVNHYNYS